MPRSVLYPDAPRVSRELREELQRREEQRREAQARIIARPRMPPHPGPDYASSEWPNFPPHTHWSFDANGVDFAPVTVPAQRFFSQSITDTLAAPLPRATVTPQQMIERIVNESRLAASAQYVKEYHAESYLRPDHSPESVGMVQRDINRVLKGHVAEAANSKATTKFSHDGGGRLRGRCAVVVMSVDDLHQMIKGIGDKVLEEAKKNGFIR